MIDKDRRTWVFRAGNQAENKRLRDEVKQKLLTLEQEREAAREIDRVAAEPEMEADIRAAFFAGSASAKDAEFEALYPRLCEERLLLNARRDIPGEEAAALAQAVPAVSRGAW